MLPPPLDYVCVQERSGAMRAGRTAPVGGPTDTNVLLGGSSPAE